MYDKKKNIFETVEREMLFILYNIDIGIIYYTYNIIVQYNIV